MVEELAEPYNIFKEAGLEVDIASIITGQNPQSSHKIANIILENINKN